MALISNYLFFLFLCIFTKNIFRIKISKLNTCWCIPLFLFRISTCKRIVRDNPCSKMSFGSSRTKSIATWASRADLISDPSSRPLDFKDFSHFDEKIFDKVKMGIFLCRIRVTVSSSILPGKFKIVNFYNLPISVVSFTNHNLFLQKNWDLFIFGNKACE